MTPQFRSHDQVKTSLVAEQLDTPVDVSYEDEVLQGNGLVDIRLGVYESHTHQRLILLEIPHEDLQRN